MTLVSLLLLLTLGWTPDSVGIPLGGNAWVLHDDGARVTTSGVEGWSTPGSVVRTWFRVDRAGILDVSASVVGPGARSEITLSIGRTARGLHVAGSSEEEYSGGSFRVDAPGYVAVDLTGVSTEGTTFGRPTALHISGSAVTAAMSYVHDDEGGMFYWGRRGPSTHFRWGAPEGVDVRWLYSEVTVPVGQDVEGSYFMANGFQGGYFGMQVNGPRRRVFLFSIWSPYETDDPSSIPQDYRVTLNRKGDGVLVGEFGDEGSGGQSRLPFLWSAGTTYRFITEVRPTGDGATDYTAWVNLPEAGGWHLVASFRRPHTDSYARSLYSFVENFEPENGDRTRSAFFDNQWVADATGTWHEVRDLTFQTDATGARGWRMDFAAGVEAGKPFMKMGGFFDDFVERGTVFTRAASPRPPAVDLRRSATSFSTRRPPSISSTPSSCPPSSSTTPCPATGRPRHAHLAGIAEDCVGTHSPSAADSSADLNGFDK